MELFLHDFFRTFAVFLNPIVSRAVFTTYDRSPAGHTQGLYLHTTQHRENEGKLAFPGPRGHWIDPE
jgi:hypothetical protein